MTRKRVDNQRQTDRWSYLWLVLGAVLMMLSFGRFSLAFAAWLGPVFIIRFFRSQGALKGFGLTMLGLYAASAIAWRPIVNFFAFESLPVYLVLVVVMALQYSLPFLADRLLAPRLKGFSATLVYPLAATAIYVLYNLVSPLGSFGTVGYEQYHNLSLIQLVSVTGLWGLTFLVSWLGPVVNWAWERSFDWSETRGGLAVFAGIVGLVLLFGSLRLAFSFPQPGTVQIHGFSPEYELIGDAPDFEKDMEGFRRYRQEVNDSLIRGTIREAEGGAQIVLWHEWAGGGMEEHYDDLLARSRGVAEDQGIFLATGAGILFPDDERMPENRLMLIAPSGEIVMDHLKFGATLVDGIAPGDGILRTVDTPYGTLSGIVCYDGDFPMIVKQAGRNGTDILLIAHGEPNVGAAQLHAQQHIFRAIENGVSVFRADSVRGLSFATDPYGRILAMTNNLTASERAISAQVPTHGVFTLYSVIGDLFGWMSVAGFAVTVAWAVVRGRRAKRAESSQSEGQMPS